MLSMIMSCALVLISTYWNVNTISDKDYMLALEVLISTYWNVNCDDWAKKHNSYPCFNLNLLECKFRYFHSSGFITAF